MGVGIKSFKDDYEAKNIFKYSYSKYEYRKREQGQSLIKSKRHSKLKFRKRNLTQREMGQM